MDERAARERVADEPAQAPSRSRRAAVRRVAEPVVDDPPVVGLGGGPLDQATSTGIRSTTGRGEPLDPATRRRMEPAFGVDLQAVRIHRDDAEAPRLMAKAGTIGTDIHFAARQYQPATPTGQELLAHELAHVVQQGGATVRRHIDTEVALTALREARDATARTQAFTTQIAATKAVIAARLANDADKKKEVNDRLKDANKRFTDAIKDPTTPRLAPLPRASSSMPSTPSSASSSTRPSPVPPTRSCSRTRRGTRGRSRRSTPSAMAPVPPH